MKFSTAKYLVLSILLFALTLSFVGLFGFSEGSQGQIIIEIICVGLLGVSILAGILWCRCPYCKKSLFIRMFKYTRCPKCNKRLIDKK